MPGGNFFDSKSRGSSQFWQGLHKIKHLFKWGAIHKVRDGKKTSFWRDVWCGEVPLKTQFPELFKICRDPTAWVCECWDVDGWNISLRRSLTAGEADVYDCLINVLQ